MISVPRAAVSVLAFLFGVFQLCLGAFWISKYDEPVFGVAALLGFFVLYVPTILLFKGIQIPQWVAALNFAFASVIPAFVHMHLSEEFHGTYATWHIGAIGILLGATALRGQPIYAWAATFIVSASTINVEGAKGAYQGGLLGMILLVFVGHATRLGIARAEADIAIYAKAAQAGASQLAAAEAIRDAQLDTFNSSLPRIQPLLQRIISSKGKLSEDERREAMLLEAELNDEIIGRAFMTSMVRAAARMARMRGVEIHFIDEGGLDGATTEELREISKRIVEILDSRQNGRVTIRATKGETWRVTVTCYPRGAVSPDLVVRL